MCCHKYFKMLVQLYTVNILLNFLPQNSWAAVNERCLSFQWKMRSTGLELGPVLFILCCWFIFLICSSFCFFLHSLAKGWWSIMFVQLPLFLTSVSLWHCKSQWFVERNKDQWILQSRCLLFQLCQQLTEAFRLLKRCGAILIGLTRSIFNCNVQEVDTKQ